MKTVRAPAVAGMFYPGSAKSLAHAIAAHLDTARPKVAGRPVPKAVIVPHAGYVYSGSTAALAYALLERGRDRLRRVVLLGPCHHVYVRGLALSTARGWETPLGEVPLASAEALSGLAQVVASDAAHAPEHSLEVQVPFLQTVLNDVELLPLAVGEASPEEVADVLDAVWGGPETVVVISSDLSHYLPYARANEVDLGTVADIGALRVPLTHHQACGATPVNGLLVACQRRGLRPDLLGRCNSGDTAGDRHRVVGYAAFAVNETSTEDHPTQSAVQADSAVDLPALARAAIAERLGVPVAGRPFDARSHSEPGAAFVTLTVDGRLRGCIGSLEARRPLLEDVRDNALNAAFRDPRFPALSAEELDRVRIEVSVLSPAEPFPVRDRADACARLRPAVDGVILHAQGRHATLLPQVWDQLPDPHQFLSHLFAKAGVHPDHWGPDVRLERYTVTAYREARHGHE